MPVKKAIKAKKKPVKKVQANKSTTKKVVAKKYLNQRKLQKQNLAILLLTTSLKLLHTKLRKMKNI